MKFRKFDRETIIIYKENIHAIGQPYILFKTLNWKLKKKRFEMLYNI